jgi:hypothetical protein
MREKKSVAFDVLAAVIIEDTISFGCDVMSDRSL